MKNIEKILKITNDMGIIKASEVLSMRPVDLIYELGLDIKTFEDLKFKPFHNGVVGVMMFDNGYGVSVVKHDYSYGGREGLYELAVLDSEGSLTYDTEITGDVLGYLTPEDVSQYMIMVQDLKS